jgi:hypothetical protein
MDVIRGLAVEAPVLIKDPTKYEERTDRKVIEKLESIIRVIDDELNEVLRG